VSAPCASRALDQKEQAGRPFTQRMALSNATKE
jgi:hypothetical protein